MALSIENVTLNGVDYVIVPTLELSLRSDIRQITPAISNYLLSKDIVFADWALKIVYTVDEHKPTVFGKSITMLGNHFDARGLCAFDKVGFTQEQWSQLHI